MSTNKTSNLNLHSWVGSDPIRRIEWNENFDKLDEHAGSVNVQLAEKATKSSLYQSDLIDTINRLKTYDSMFYMRKSGTTDLSIIFRKNNDAIVWEILSNIYDDFLQLGKCYSGTVVPMETLKETIAYTLVSGTLVDSTDPYKWMSTVGGKISVTFTGTGVDFRHVKNTNGGLWRFTINTNPVQTIDVDTYNTAMVENYVKPLFRNLTLGTYTVTGEFIGAGSTTDPTPRGWFDYINSFDIYTESAIDYTVKQVDELVIGFSNKELALQMRPLGTSITPAYSPMHSGIGTTFDREAKQIYIDGTLLADVLSLTSNKIYSANDITFVQKMYAQIPNYANRLVEYDVSHVFNKNGNVDIVGKLNVLENIEVVELFTFMLPASKPVVDRVITSKGNNYPVIKTDGSILDTTNEEGKETTSYAFLSSDNDYVIAGRINDIANTLVFDFEIDKNLYNESWIQFRDSTMSKVYTYAIRDGILNAGDIVRFSQTFNCAKIPDINGLI